MIPQLDGTFNISDDRNSDSHSYLDLASTNIIAYRMRGQKQRHEVNERANTNRCSALKEYAKPNTNVKILSWPENQGILFFIFLKHFK